MSVSSQVGVLTERLPALTYANLARAALVFLLPVCLLAPFYGETFERDEGVFATLARTILSGDVPYRDAWDHKPPLVSTWYAASFLVFGETIEAPRIAASLSAALTCVVVFLLVKRMYGERVGLTAGLLLGLCYGIPYLQINANSEVFLMLPLVGSLYAFYRAYEERDPRWLLLAGAVAGVAFMHKQVAMWNFFALAGFLAWQGRQEQDWAAARHRLLVFAGGAALALLPFFAYFAVRGALDDFVYAIFTYNELFARQVPILTRFIRMFSIKEPEVLAATAFLWVGAIVSVARMLRGRPGAREVLLLLWVAACYIGVKTSGRDYPHYYVQMLPGLVILTALVVTDLAERPLGALRAAVPILLVVTFLGAFGWSAHVYAFGSLNEIHEEKFPDELVTRADFEAQAVADYVRLTTQPDDTIFNLGRESQLYFLAGRDPATQFIYDRSFWLSDDTFDEAMRDLRRNRPAVIVDSLSIDLVGSRAGDLPTEFSEFLAENYEYVGRLHYAQIYRLNRPERPFGLMLWTSQFSGVY